MATVSDTTRSITGLFQSLGATVRNTGLLITAGAGIAGGAMVALSQKAERVNAAFREVDTLTQSATRSQEKYGEIVSNINTQTGIQANKLEIVDALYQSISAGVADTEQAQRQFLNTATTLANVGLTDLSTTVDVLSTVMNTYGFEASEAGDISKDLFQTVQFGKVRLQELAPVMGRVAALGSDIGAGFEELTASMAILTRSGFEARVAATSLRSTIQEFNKPSERMKTLLLDIATQQNGLVQELTAGNDAVSGLASEYRNLNSNVQRYSNIISEQRDIVESNSLAIQRARLAITAIEEDRVSSIEDTKTAELARSNSVQQLKERISDLRFELNEARVVEKEYRNEQSEAEAQIEDLKKRFKEQADVAGDLGDGIGRLFVENQGLVDTLIDIKNAAEEEDIALSQVFNRTRALQGVLALVGEDGAVLTQVLQQMKAGTLDAKEAFNDLSESQKDQLDIDSFKEFKNSIKDINLEDLEDEVLGPFAKVRNAIARISETATELGQIFDSQVAGVISDVADSFTRLKNFLEGLSESQRDNIARFATLAVSIGLVLGPMLLLAGQAAILVSTLGTALLPLVIALGAGLSLLGGGLKAAANDASGFEPIVQTLTSILDSLVSFLSRVGKAFMIVMDGVSFAGQQLFSVIGSVFDAISESKGSIDPLMVAASDLSTSFIKLGQTIKENEDAIVNFISTAINDLITIIPNLVSFLIGLGAVFIDIATNKVLLSFIAALVSGIIKATVAVSKVLGAIGKWMQENSNLIADLLLIVGTIVTVVAAIGAIAAAISGLIAAGPPGAFLLIVSAIGKIGSVIASAVPFFGILSSALSGIVTVIGLFIKGLSALSIAFTATANFLGVTALGMYAIIAQVVVTIVSIFQWLYKVLVGNSIIPDLVQAIKDEFTSLVDDAKGWGEDLIDDFVTGIKNKVSDVGTAMKKVTDKIGSYLPSSPSENGYFSTQSPKEIGGSITKDIATGAENKSEEITFDNVTTDTKKLEENTEIAKPTVTTDPEEEMSDAQKRRAFRTGETSKQSSDGSDENGGVTVEEKAIFFQKGAFQGVSDEELPRKVRKVIDQSTNEIIKDLEAKGVEVE